MSFVISDNVGGMFVVSSNAGKGLSEMSGKMGGEA